MGRSLPCDEPLAKESACGLRGPLDTVEFWYSSPSAQNPAMEDAAVRHTVMTFSEEGRLIEREIRNDAVYASLNRFESDDGGLTVMTLSEWANNGQAHRIEEVVSFNEKGQMVSRKENLDGGPFTGYMKQEFDSDGHGVSLLHCSTDGKYC